MNPSTRLSDSFREKINRPSTRALNLGFIYFKNGELSDAEKLARESLHAEKSDKGYRLLGEVLLAQNRHSEALEAFSQSLEMNPRQEFCLNKVCELIEPTPAAIERLEFWAHQAARQGFLDISENFVKASQIARQAGFPNNPALSKIAKDIAQVPMKATSPLPPFSLPSGRPSLNSSTSSIRLEETIDSVNKAVAQVLDEVRQLSLVTRSQVLDEVKQLSLVTRSQDAELKELRDEVKQLTLLVTPERKNTASNASIPPAASTPLTHAPSKAQVQAPAASWSLAAALAPTPPSVPASAPAPAPVPAAAPVFGLSTGLAGNAPSFGTFANATFGVSTNQTSQSIPFAPPKLQVQASSATAAPTNASVTSTTTFGGASTNFFQDAMKAQNLVKSDSTTTSSFTFGTSSSSFSTPNKPIFAGFNTPPQPIFGSPKVQNSNEEENDDDPEADRVDVSKYKLPELKNIPAKIEVKTGEEDEEVVYSQRAKVFRFDTAAKQWKERGLGDLKILKHKQTNKCRIILRREQVHKIAINFYITSDMVFKPMNNADNAVQWTAVDFSDEEPLLSGLAAKFKNKEITDIFVKKVEELKSCLVKGDAEVKSPATSNNVAPATASPPNPSPPQNSAPAPVFGLSSSSGTNAPTFGSVANTPTFGSMANASTFGSFANTTFGAATTPASQSISFTPPKLQVAPATTRTESATTATNSFGGGSTNFFQEAMKAQNLTKSDTNNTSSFTFGGPASFPAPAKPLFAGFNTPPQPIFGAKPNPIFGAPKAQEGGEDENDDDPEADRVDVSKYKLPELKNIPAKIEVKTGEENEEVIYSQRAKVFRFDTAVKQWKERGLGDLKILKHKETQKYRIVMRREQVHKIAVNFYITSDMVFKPMNNADNAVQWTAVDFSDEKPLLSGLAAKFKNKEITDVFVKKVEELKSCLGSGDAAAASSDVEIVFEKMPPPALIEKSRKLQLPDSFYNHLTAEGCTGCPGCQGEDDCDDDKEN